MDYYGVIQKWTTCCVKMFTQHYNDAVNADDHFCMALAGDGTGVGKFYLSLKFN